MHEYEKSGGQLILQIVNDRIDIVKVEKPPMLGIIKDESVLGDEEGIPGHISGVEERNRKGLPPVKLGLLPMDKDLVADIEEELTAEDTRQKESRKEEELGATSGTLSLLEEFQKIKREDSEDAPMRDDIPLPPYKGSDIDAEVKNVKDYRDRFHLSSLSATANIQPGLEGVSPALSGSLPSCVMYTFHNTNDGLNSLAFSEDTTLCAGGFSESYVRIWSLKGEKLFSANPSENENTTSTRKYIGHAGPVFGVSFSPDAKYLLSCSEDKSTRLWSLETHTALVAYKGHDHPVWDVSWGPFGHYFATASHDHTARLWSTEHITPLRVFAGHLSDVDVVAWHPNNLYVLTGSNDKTLRMWDINRGVSVRVFIGHTSPITCIAVSPNGRYMASGGDDGLILLWDLGTGKRMKTMRGHGKAPVWSLTWSVEGEVLVSGGADNTVRVWTAGEDKNNSTIAGGVGGAAGAAGQQSIVGAEMVINGIGGIGPGDVTTKVDGVLGGVKLRKDKKEVVATYVYTPGLTVSRRRPFCFLSSYSLSFLLSFRPLLPSVLFQDVFLSCSHPSSLIMSPCHRTVLHIFCDDTNFNSNTRIRLCHRSDHLAVYHTKRTPVYKVMFTKKNLVLAGGAFLP